MKSLKIIIFTFLFIGGGFVLGAPLPPQPGCKITAEVIETGVLPYDPDKIAGEVPMRWIVISIIEVEKDPIIDSEYAFENYCTEQYYKGREVRITTKESYIEESTIEGVIFMGEDEWGPWYVLKDVIVVYDPEIEDSKEMSIFIYIAITLIVIAVLYFIYKNKK